MKEKIKNFLKSPFSGTALSKIIVILGILIAILAVFFAGETVGYKRAEFSYHFGENYNRMFGGRNNMMKGLPFSNDQYFPNSHGAAGKILKIQLPTIIVEDSSGVEKSVMIATSTIIKNMRDTISSTNLHVDDFVVVLGVPNQNGQIDATLIRLMSGPVSTTSPRQ